MSRAEQRPFAQELALAVASTVAAELLTGLRGIVRREHEAWMARRDQAKAPPRRGRK